MSRTGLVWLGVKNPPTVADHIFRSAIFSWLLGEKNNLNIEKIIKIGFAHDLGEVYSGDLTPFWGLVPKNEKERKEALKKWIRLPLKEKEKRNKQEFKREKNHLKKLLNFLPSELKDDIFSCWFEYKKSISPEGRFFHQTDKIDSMIEALEALDEKDYEAVTPWWEEADELITDPLLDLFLKVIQEKFYDQKIEVSSQFDDKKTIKNMEGILGFSLELGKLKTLPRQLWVSLGVKEPETIGAHIFTLALMAWVFGKRRKDLNMEKLLKMALCHELPSIYTGDLMTPYDRVLPKEEKERRKIFTKWPRLSKKEKEKKFSKDYQEERKALQKLTQKLPTSTKEEIIQFFDEYKNASSAEARFLNQLNVLAVLFQALLYQKKDKDLPVDFLWEWALERCDNKICLDFLEELKNKFYGKRFVLKLFDLVKFRRKEKKD